MFVWKPNLTICHIQPCLNLYKCIKHIISGVLIYYQSMFVVYSNIKYLLCVYLHCSDMLIWPHAGIFSGVTSYLRMWIGAFSMPGVIHEIIPHAMKGIVSVDSTKVVIDVDIYVLETMWFMIVFFFLFRDNSSFFEFLNLWIWRTKTHFA